MEKSENTTLKSTLLAVVFFSIMTLFSVTTTRAQTDTARCDAPGQLHIDLGVSLGATLYNNGNDHSPYYSEQGYTLQIPLMAHWKLNTKWQLSAGLRYDFTWMPLYHTVEPVDQTLDGISEHGLQLSQTPLAATQKAHAFNSFVGIPIELKWYPWSNSLAFSVDFFAGYAVSQYFDIKNIIHNADGTLSNDGYDRDTFNAMNRWKMEVGFTFSTDRLGLIHGLRFFTNLLPTYKDPDTGSKIFMSGMSIFL
mgnify:CR=1 FL=1